MQGLLRRILAPDEFMSPYGLRSLSRCHDAHPFSYGGREVRYEPAESDSKIKGGNSNWRGPIWFPTSFLMIESLRKLGKAYGPHFGVALPDGAGREVTLSEMAGVIVNRMIRNYTLYEETVREVVGG